jgi:excisionase family DNA binding protein
MSRDFALILVWLLAVSASDMSMQDAATYLRVTTRTVRTMVLDGRLKAYQLGPRVIRFRRSEIDAALTPINVQPAAIATPRKPGDDQAAAATPNLRLSKTSRPGSGA